MSVEEFVFAIIYYSALMIGQISQLCSSVT